MNVLIINLPDSKSRLKFQVEQLTSFDLDYKVINAVSTATLQESEYNALSQTWQRPMRASEVACFLSHKKAWHCVVEENRPCLIIEDDALFSRNIVKLLEEIAGISDLDLVTLENRSRKKIVSKKVTSLCCNSFLYELYQDRTGAAGYILWPKSAKILINKSDKGKIALADAFISSSYELKAFQVEPAAIVQLDQCAHYDLECDVETQSTITPVATQHPIAEGLLATVKFKLRRINAQFSMGFRQLSVLNKSRRRFIKINKHDFTR
ncbi:MAG: glycosyltransferase family 25 protein [Cocleimonas sp.]